MSAAQATSLNTAGGLSDLAVKYHRNLRHFLEDHLNKDASAAGQQRQSAKDRLSKLTKTQFQELATDVYDEVVRRQQNSKEVPFLPVRDEFHPKRNQARQKLATLAVEKFKDLASDVMYEIERRYGDVLAANVTASVFAGNNSSAMNSVFGGPTPVANSVASNIPPTINKPKPVPVASQAALPPLPPPTLQQQQQSSYSNNAPSNQSRGYTPQRVENAVPAPKVAQANANRRPSNASDGESDSSEALNFESLDNLMADLGEMLHTKKSSSQSDSTSRQAAPVAAPSRQAPENNFNNAAPPARNEVELERSQLQVAQLQSDLRRLRDESEGQVRNLTHKIEKLEIELTNAKSNQNSQSLEKVEVLQEQIDEQKNLIANQEETIQELKNKIQLLQDDYDEQQKFAADLEKDVNALLEEVKELRVVNDELKAASELDRKNVNTLLHEKSSLEAQFKEAQLEIKRLKSAPLTSPAVKTAASSGQTSPGFSSPHQRQASHASNASQRQSYTFDQQLVSNYLMAVDDLLQAARSDKPSDVLVSMKSIVASVRQISDSADQFEREAKVRPNPPDLSKCAKYKTQLSSSVSHLISVAKSHATDFGKVPVSAIDNATSQLTTNVVDMTQWLKMNSGGQTSSGTSSDLQSPVESNNNRSSSTADQASDPDSQPRSPDIANEDDLMNFLESQTELIIQSIQALLAAMKSATHFADLAPHINKITDIVDYVSRNTRRAFHNNIVDSDRRTKGDLIVQDLASSNRRLEDFSAAQMNQDQQGGLDKSAKQKLASSAYELAKFTKELVNLLE